MWNISQWLYSFALYQPRVIQLTGWNVWKLEQGITPCHCTSSKDNQQLPMKIRRMPSHLKAVLPSTLEKRWPEDCAINLKSDISKSISQFSSFSCFCSNGVLSGSLVWLLYTLLSSSINLVWECARMHLAHSQDFFPEEQTLREETFHFFVLSVKCECDSTKRENSVLSASQTSSLHAPQSAANSRNVDVLKNFKLESIRHFEYISSNKLLL